MLAHEPLNRHRRLFLGLCGATAISAIPSIASATAQRQKGVRSISLYNLNTTERLKADYWIDGQYQSDVLEQINRLLRDHRSDAVGNMDKDLMDLLYRLSLKLGTRKELGIVCGYRSPQTNAQMRTKSKSVAKNSYHVKGMAVDLRISDRSCADVYHAARGLNAGGVGFYGRSNFVHVDVGPVRTWGPKPKTTA